MRQFLLLCVVCCCFTTFGFSQATGPRRSTQSQKTSSPGAQTSEFQSAEHSSDISESRNVNDLEINIKGLTGNVADQNVVLNLLITNSKANSKVIVRYSEAFDQDGEKYVNPRGGTYLEEILYTDVPRKVSVMVAGIPSKVKLLKLFKFQVYNQLTRKDVVVEFRNLDITWK